MSTYKIKYIPFEQNNQSFLIAVMPFSCIDKHAKVLVYGIDEDGYQRKPEPKHYNKIKDYILEDLTDFILPTSIILSVDKNDFDNLKSDNTNEANLLLTDKTRTDIFRIVDGQHRIYGLKEAAKNKKQINNFLLPVIILITTKNKRSIELQVFSDINSKAKRVKVDLIQLAKQDYRLKEKTITEKNIVEHISIKTAYILKEDRKESVWHNAIKFDIHNELVLGIVGINTFMESIESIVKTYLKIKPINPKEEYNLLLKHINKATEDISVLLFDCWDTNFRNKWSECFLNQQVALDIDEELRDFHYNKEYYIQKTLGVKALNGIVGDIYKDVNGNSQQTKMRLATLIKNTKIKNEDWKTGKTFSGLSSEAGVKKVKEAILRT